MFETLEEYYHYFEKDNSLNRDFGISNKLSSIIEHTRDETLKQRLSYELYFNDLNFDKGTLIPKYTIGANSYPELSLFDDDFEYIKSRASSEIFVNSRNKAKYNHLLWQSPIKHIDYAQRAIDNYLDFLKQTELSSKDNVANMGFALYYENLYALSVTIKYKSHEIIEFLIGQLNKNNLNGYRKQSLISFIILKKSKVPEKYLKSFFEYLKSALDEDLFPEFSKYYLQLLIQLCLKQGDSAKEYQNRLGDLYVQESEQHEESFAVHDFYIMALKQYQKAGNKEKIEQVTVLVEKAKDKLNFKLVQSEHSSPELQKWYDDLIVSMSELANNRSSADIYQYLILAQIFPKAEVLDQNIKSTIMDLFSTMNFDINRNVSGFENQGINFYNIQIQNISVRHLWLIFSKGISSQKIGFKTLMEYCQTHTWYKDDIVYTDSNGKRDTFRWLDLLMPSFASYFRQSEIDLKERRNSATGYILCIDSLVLKFEGVLRSFSRNIGAQTIDIKGNGTQERISFEKLLQNEKIKEVIPADDIALFRYIFTSEGLNLRNNIAHCFYKPQNYSAAVMWLLTCAFLRLGNYEFKAVDD